MVSSHRQHSQMHLVEWKLPYCDLNFTEIYSSWLYICKIIIGSRISLVQTRQQAITWTNDDPAQYSGCNEISLYEYNVL